MRVLFTVTALIEFGAGLALICVPILTVNFLLGSSLESPASIIVSRIGGTALLALGLACWFARRDGRSDATRGLAAAMFIYNVGAVVVLTLSEVKLGMRGIMLWPTVALHAGMAVWCIACLQRNSQIKV